MINIDIITYTSQTRTLFSIKKQLYWKTGIFNLYFINIFLIIIDIKHAKKWNNDINLKRAEHQILIDK